MSTEINQRLEAQSCERSWFVFLLRTLLILIISLIIYVLSSGPMVSFCYWLQYRTGYDEILFILYIYQPLFWVCSIPPFDAFYYWYFGWWVPKLFMPSGPG